MEKTDRVSGFDQTLCVRVSHAGLSELRAPAIDMLFDVCCVNELLLTTADPNPTSHLASPQM